MNYILNVTDTGGKKVSFSHICPESSGTIEKQIIRFQSPGLTLIAPIPHELRSPFHSAIESLMETGHGFRSVDQLHFTILGLFAGQNWNTALLPSLSKHIQDFFNSKSLGTINVKFTLVRPGFFSGQSGYSDGTVVAMADNDSSTSIMDIAKELSKYLSEVEPKLFPEQKSRPLPGVWCTLGYFHEPDFPLDKQVFEAFLPSKKFMANVSVNTVMLNEFSLKSLADGIVRSLISL